MDKKKVKIVVTDPLVGRMPEISQERYPEENKRVEWVMAERGNDEEEWLVVVDVGSKNDEIQGGKLGKFIFFKSANVVTSPIFFYPS